MAGLRGSASWSRLAEPEGGPWRCLSRWHAEGVLSSNGKPRGSGSWGGGGQRTGELHDEDTGPTAAGGCLERRAVLGAALAGWALAPPPGGVGQRTQLIGAAGDRLPARGPVPARGGEGEGRTAREAVAQRVSHSAPLG